MWSTSYLISQICMILAMGCFCLSLFTKNKKFIIIISATNAVLYSLHYFLLGKISVVLLNVLSIVRGIFFYYDDRDEIKHNFVSLIFITLSLVLVSYNTLITWVDLLPLIAVLLYTFSLWWKNITFYRYASLAGSICWIIFNIVQFRLRIRQCFINNSIYNGFQFCIFNRLPRATLLHFQTCEWDV